MTREAFIRKWLANPQKQYTEQCRDEMRNDLDLVISSAFIQPSVISSVCKCKVCGKPFGDRLSLYEHYDEEHNKQTDL